MPYNWWLLLDLLRVGYDCNITAATMWQISRDLLSLDKGLFVPCVYHNKKSHQGYSGDSLPGEEWIDITNRVGQLFTQIVGDVCR